MTQIMIAASFWSRVEIAQTGCWLWRGTVKPDGYGLTHDFTRKSSIHAHRWSYEFLKSDIPKGFELDHLCNVRTCVNPAHLEIVTHAENVKRAAANRSHCRNGHLLSPENIHVIKACKSRSTYKACLECFNRQQQRKSLLQKQRWAAGIIQRQRLERMKRRSQ